MTRLFFLFILLIFNSCTWNELPEIICVPEEEVYIQSVQPIIEENCMSCHSTNANSLVILGTYDKVIDAVNNYSLRDEVVSGRMPMSGSPPLSQSEINVIKNWIDCE